MEKKNVPFECKVNLEKGEFEGYASTYQKDLVNDVIVRGAYQKTLQERFTKNQIKVLWQHDPNIPIGKPKHMEEDSNGLYVVASLTKGVQKADEALLLMESGVIDTMSIGYDVIKDELSDDGNTRLLKELRLYEFSPVTFPANPTAHITGVRKSLDELLREFKHDEMAMLLKEGRTLSSKNVQAIENVIQTLTSILEQTKSQHFEPNSTHSKAQDEPKEFTRLFEEMTQFAQKLKAK